MSTVAQLYAACPSAFVLYKGESGGSMDGINTPGQRLTETLTWRVLDAEYPAFSDVVGGLVETVGGPFGGMQRRVPLRHPKYPGLIASGYRSGSLKGVVDQWFKWRNVTVTFQSPAFDTQGANAFITVRTVPAQRTVECTPAMFRVAGVAPTFDPEFPIDGTRLSLTAHQLPSLSLATYQTYQSTTNDSPFWGYPIGTVKYLGPGTDRTSRVGAAESYEITHEFEHSKVPWNYIFSTGGSQVLMTYNAGTYRYPLANLNYLFA